VLGLRRRDPALFGAGSAYAPLVAEGDRSDHVVAFARTLDGRGAAVVAPRLVLRLRADGGAPVGDGVWGETAVLLPQELAGRSVRDVLTGATHVPAADGRLLLGAAFGRLPVACLTW
jgi:(1->4)-alpha-D-glucan 1-alpha-D-glucosylmutase